MSRPRRILDRSASRRARHRAVRPGPEVLEERHLLSVLLGDKWTYDSRITYSFMPDGTTIGGVPSVLFQTLNADYPTGSWEQQIEAAASVWETSSNINLARVSDGGEAVGTSGNQQDDSRFGDIRIGAIPMAAGVLAVTFLPPPANGGTDAGDILLNSNVAWKINSNYDLMTVTAHEFGHALGLGDESTDSSAVMYGTYTGIKQALDSDDIGGIDSIYGTRAFDQFNSGKTRDNAPFSATNINSYIGGNAQLAIPRLDITTPGDSEWFYVNVPSTTTGSMTVTVQSSNLSSLSPTLQVYSSAMQLVGQASAANSMGATVSVSSSVAAGQGYYIKVLATNGYGGIGGYGLLANFGSQYQAPIPPPNTVVAQQPDQGGGSTNNAIGPINPVGGSNDIGPLPVFTSIGSLTGWTEGLNVAASPVLPVSAIVPPSTLAPTTVSVNPIAPIALFTGTTSAVAAPVPVHRRLKAVRKPVVLELASRHRPKHGDAHLKIEHSRRTK